MLYDKIREFAKASLNDKKFNHCLRVEKMAVSLAKQYGVDIEKAKIAAISHDCAKFFSHDKMINNMKQSGQYIDEIQLSVPYLLHGPVAAIRIKETFNVTDEDILNAIRFHTTGRKGMGMLEKIIYIADLIEEGRDFKGVEEIRKEAFKNIDRALVMGCNTTMSYVMLKGQVIHPSTVELRNSIILCGGNKSE
ncbi:MAG: bis(5'-nucleosyl)-tetraphosphatase (symmetrical) YqeK [Clostridium sp.]|uniref:bis(5'-nucleosyl)-tetraphosphatase (symmetrical) YqeK n=1 Tax=Clostridium sp. TaxID=1506 RepID=UPI002FC7F468